MNNLLIVLKPVYLLGAVTAIILGGSDIHRVYDSSNKFDERSDLIARMKKTMACQDTQKEDVRDLRDSIISTRECALLLKDLEIKDEFVYDSSPVSIGAEKNGSDIVLFIYAGTYTIPRTITLPQSRDYLKKKEKK